MSGCNEAHLHNSHRLAMHGPLRGTAAREKLLPIGLAKFGSTISPNSTRRMWLLRLDVETNSTEMGLAGAASVTGKAPDGC